MSLNVVSFQQDKAALVGKVQDLQKENTILKR